MKPSLNRTTILKLVVHGIELCAAFEERDNKQNNAKFYVIKKRELSFFFHKIALRNVYKHKCLVSILQINTAMSDFSSVKCSILSTMVCTVTFSDDILLEFY